MRASNLPVAELGLDERSSFIARTYVHLAGAIFAFIALEFLFFKIGLAERIMPLMTGGRGNWAVVLIAFMGVSWLADRWARNATNLAVQYLGLMLYVVAEAVIFVPLLYMAALQTSANIIPTAAIITLTLFSGLTGVVFITRKDVSFLRGVLVAVGFGALGLIAASLIFGFSLGNVFAYAMVAFAAGYILYDTSNVLLHYRSDQHASAALALFASVALMFWYVVRILMNRR